MHVSDHANMAECIDSDQLSLSKTEEAHVVCEGLETRQCCVATMAECASSHQSTRNVENHPESDVPTSSESRAHKTAGGSIIKIKVDKEQRASEPDIAGGSSQTKEVGGSYDIITESNGIDNKIDSSTDVKSPSVTAPSTCSFCATTRTSTTTAASASKASKDSTPVQKLKNTATSNRKPCKHLKASNGNGNIPVSSKSDPTDRDYIAYQMAMVMDNWDCASLSSTDSEDVNSVKGDTVVRWIEELKKESAGEGEESSEYLNLNLYNDWDYGLSSSSVDEDEVEFDAYEILLSLIEQGAELDEDTPRTRSNQPSAPLYPHHPTRYLECEICLSKSYFWSRFCCHFKVCNECVDTYVKLKVEEAQVHIECPNDKCKGYIHRNEIRDRLSDDLKQKFDKFLVDANKDPCKKTCPACSSVHTMDPDVLTARKKLKYGLKVCCTQCKLEWCFLCQAPFHTDVTCKQFRKGDEMVRQWAKETMHGRSNAQRCPKCKIYIQKTDGCDHMKCTQCGTDFCYRCGDRYVRIKFMGNHFSKYSLFGCKYRLLPKKPMLRRLIRGTSFAARIVGGVVLAGLGLAAGAGLIGVSVFILPGYGIFRLHRRRKILKQRKQCQLRMQYLVLDKERERAMKEYSVALNSQGNTSTGNEESEVENPDSQQVQVIVHRAVSVTEETAEEPAADCELYTNCFTADGTEVVIEPSKDAEEGDQNFVYVADIKEVPNKGGYSTVVANIVSKVGQVVEESCVGGKASDDEKMSEGHDGQAGKGETIDMKDGKSVKAEADLDGELSCQSQHTQPLDKDGNQVSETCHCVVDGDKQSGNSQRSEENAVASGKSVDVTIVDQENAGKMSIDDSKASKLDTKGGGGGSKEALHGCFGNIFSKRNQNTSLDSDCIIPPKSLGSGSAQSSKFLQRKSATWEKIRNSKGESVFNLPSLENSGDRRAIYVPRSPSVVPALTNSKDLGSLTFRDKEYWSVNAKEENNSEMLKNCRDISVPDCPEGGKKETIGSDKSHGECGTKECDLKEEVDDSGYLVSQVNIVTRL